MKRLFYIVVALFMLSGCQSDSSGQREVLIQEKLVEKLDKFSLTLRENCRKDALETATTLVDSIIISMAKARKDSIDKPPKPEKPEKPLIILPADSMPVKPFLGDTIEG